MWHKPTKGLKPLWILSLFSWESECCVGLVFCPLMFLDSQAFFNPFSCGSFVQKHGSSRIKKVWISVSNGAQSRNVWAVAPCQRIPWKQKMKKWALTIYKSTMTTGEQLSCFAGRATIESQLLRQLKLQWAQCLDKRHRLNVTNGTTKFDHASQNKNMAGSDGAVWLSMMTKTCSYINLSHSTCPSHFHVCRSKSREWIAMLCHTCETLVYE